MFELINVQYFEDALKLGAGGMLFGVMFPWIFWLIGSFFDVMRKFTR